MIGRPVQKTTLEGVVSLNRPALQMLSKYCTLALALLSLGATAAFAQQPAAKITEIVIVGNKNINRESILATSGLKVGDPLSQVAINQAKGRLLSTQNFGMHQPDNPEDGVRITAATDPKDGSTVITITVDENDLVTGVNLSGTGPVPAADIRALLQTKEGRVLNLGTLKQDADRIKEYYTSKGYTALVSSDVVLEKGILNLPIIVGVVNKIKVVGARKTREVVVTREMKLKQGDYFNVDQFGKDINRIFNTNLFEDVSPAIVQSEIGKVDITLNVQERRTGTVSVFVGYSSRNSLVGGAELGEENFMGRGQQISLRWDTGGIANRNSLEVGFTEPWLDSRHTSLSVNAYDKTVYRFGQGISSVGGIGGAGTTNDYFEVHTGAQFTVSRPLTDTTRAFVGLRYDNVKVSNVDLSTEDAIALQNGPLAALSLKLTHNTRDIDLEPASGGYEVAAIDIGSADLKPVKAGQIGGVVGQVTYQKLQLDARRYLSPQGPRKKLKDKRNIFAFRVLAGFATGTLPFYEQFFVGGAESLRGYREDRFWGKNMFLGSVEFRSPLASSLTGVVFADVGDAWGGPYESVTFAGFTQHSGFKPNAGFGFGLRVVTPIGPIRIDQGFGRDGSRTHFSIGHVF